MTGNLRTSYSILSALRFLAIRLYSRFINRYARISFSQEGEDLLLRRIFENQKFGFYVDVGAHHPRRFSNTHIFYQLGWRGVNIEPNPEIQLLFKKLRSRDFNIQRGVSEQTSQLTYYMFNESALNTFDEKLAHEYESHSYKIKKEVLIDVSRLDDLLNEVVPQGVEIDFMTIDVEGYDLCVLKSNDWEKFRPKVLLVEILGATLTSVIRTEEHRFIKDQCYELIAKTVNTFIYRDTRN